MALTLARDYGARVTGITLSTEQLAEARARAAAEGLSDRVKFELLDYRAVHAAVRPHRLGRHVRACRRRPLPRASSTCCKRCLTPDGVALLHSIGRSDGPRRTNPWIAKYIFPGGYSPALSEVLPADRESGPDRHRCRDPAAALRRDAAPLAPPLRRQPRRDRRDSTTSASAGCSSSIWPARELAFRHARTT